ncbi:MAG: hypothetical protein AMXMBFR13_44790 [Phycisphaerae bacterium]
MMQHDSYGEPVRGQSVPGGKGVPLWRRILVPSRTPGPVANLTFLWAPLLAALALALLLPLVWRGWQAADSQTPVAATTESLPVMYGLPEFSLTARRGRPVTLDTLVGKVWIADFVFTSCAGPCPLMTTKMAGLQADLADAGDLRLVTITVDPVNDTPQRLQEYAQRYRAHKEKWLFLTGGREDIYRLSTEGFKLAAIVDEEGVAADPDHPILHSTRFVLVDRQGRIRGYYDGMSAESVEQLKADARRLLEEKAA